MIADALILSFWVTAISTAFVAVLGTLVGRWLAHGKGFKNTLDAVLSLPMVLPPTVTGFLLIALLGRSSPLGQGLAKVGIELTFTPVAAVIAAFVVSFPLMLRASRSAFEQLEPQYKHLATSLGCSPLRLFWKLELPIAWKRLMPGVALAFGRALGEFGATLMIAGNIRGRTQTLPLAVYDSFLRGEDRQAWIAVGVLSLGSFIVILLAQRRSLFR